MNVIFRHSRESIRCASYFFLPMSFIFKIANALYGLAVACNRSTQVTKQITTKTIFRTGWRCQQNKSQRRRNKALAKAGWLEHDKSTPSFLCDRSLWPWSCSLCENRAFTLFTTAYGWLNCDSDRICAIWSHKTFCITSWPQSIETETIHSSNCY